MSAALSAVTETADLPGPRPMDPDERRRLAMLCGRIDGHRHPAGCCCRVTAALRIEAREAVLVGCPFALYFEIDAGVVEEWCGACYVCQIEAAIYEGRI